MIARIVQIAGIATGDAATARAAEAGQDATGEMIAAAGASAPDATVHSAADDSRGGRAATTGAERRSPASAWRDLSGSLHPPVEAAQAFL